MVSIIGDCQTRTNLAIKLKQNTVIAKTVNSEYNQLKSICILVWFNLCEMQPKLFDEKLAEVSSLYVLQCLQAHLTCLFLLSHQYALIF